MIIENKLNWIGIFNLIGGAIILSIVGYGLPNTICMINQLGFDCAYGKFASYFGVILLFYLCFGNIKLVKIKEKK